MPVVGNFYTGVTRWVTERNVDATNTDGKWKAIDDESLDNADTCSYTSAFHAGNIPERGLILVRLQPRYLFDKFFYQPVYQCRLFMNHPM